MTQKCVLVTFGQGADEAGEDASIDSGGGNGSGGHQHVVDQVHDACAKTKDGHDEMCHMGCVLFVNVGESGTVVLQLVSERDSRRAAGESRDAKHDLH